MANRNLADEVDALAKGLASLRVANKRTVSRVAALEDRELESLEWLAREAKITKPFPRPLKNDPAPLLQRIRAWWAR